MLAGRTPVLLVSAHTGTEGVGQARVLTSNDNEKFSGSPVYFASDQIRWEGTKILKICSERWNMETFFTDYKHNFGFEDCRLRNHRGIKRHWYLIFLAYSLQVSGLFGIDPKPLRESSTLEELITKTPETFSAGLSNGSFSS